MKYQPPNIKKFAKAEEELSWLFTAEVAANPEADAQMQIDEALKNFSPAEVQGFIHRLMASARFKLEVAEAICMHLRKTDGAVR
jgi:hypothetical protein